jgi:hypothetical protein
MKELAAQKPGKYFVFDSATHTVVAGIETFAKQKPSRKLASDAA